MYSSENEILKFAIGVRFVEQDFKKLTPKNCLIYCDPPYIGTTEYQVSKFNHEEFWQIMRDWAKVNTVIVSEQVAPSDIRCIWEQSVKRTMDNVIRQSVVEKLFLVE